MSSMPRGHCRNSLNKTITHPERSRGIPICYLKGSAAEFLGPSRTGGYARNDEARFAPSKRFLRFLHIARALFEPGKFSQIGEANFTYRPVALFGNDQFVFALLFRPRL